MGTEVTQYLFGLRNFFAPQWIIPRPIISHRPNPKNENGPHGPETAACVTQKMAAVIITWQRMLVFLHIAFGTAQIGAVTHLRALPARFVHLRQPLTFGGPLS